MSLQSLIDTGTKLWLDSVDPDEVVKNRDLGATGATSNPAIISELVKSGRFDETIVGLSEQMGTDAAVCWAMTDYLVSQAQEVFQPVWEKTGCNDGWVSFELDPLLEDPDADLPEKKVAETYVALGRYWASGYTNRLIKVPATPAGLASLEPLAAAGVNLNVTLIFSDRQYQAAREAVWRGAQKREGGLDRFKSVYSIFVSRVDVYTDKKVPGLSDEAQGEVGLVNAKRLWRSNQEWWRGKGCKLDQEIVFASTGAKLDWQSPDYYVEALAGSDIQTNPPETNAQVQKLGKQYAKRVGELPPDAVLKEIDEKVDVRKMEDALMAEGVEKFAKPMKALIQAVGEVRGKLKAK